MSGKGWDDVVLPGFDEPEVVPTRPKSAKQAAKERTVQYQRYRANGIKCDHCIQEVSVGKSTTVKVASNTRTDKGVTTYLCFLHTVESRHQDQLNGRVVTG